MIKSIIFVKIGCISYILNTIDIAKYLQLEIGKALIANASEGFEEEDDEDSL